MIFDDVENPILVNVFKNNIRLHNKYSYDVRVIVVFFLIFFFLKFSLRRYVLFVTLCIIHLDIQVNKI